MTSTSVFQPGRLQQQDQHPIDRVKLQQQQSSGSGEFQSRRIRQAGEEFGPARPDGLKSGEAVVPPSGSQPG
jgi:hypothetical protein